MAWSKQDIVEAAYEELGLAGYQFDLTTDELVSGVRRMDAMIARWGKEGIRIGYTLPASRATSADLTTEVAVPDWTHEAIYLNLAVALSTSFGKQLLPQTLMRAYDAKQTLFAQMEPPTKTMPAEMPLGAGHRHADPLQRYVGDEAEGIRSGGEGDMEFS